MVQCASCGTPVGVLDAASGAAIEALQGKVAAIDDGLTRYCAPADRALRRNASTQKERPPALPQAAQV
jgi:DNA-directed RNA polymerase subunit N (RpoN/RPB10)